MGEFAAGVRRFRAKVEAIGEQRFRKIVLDLDTKVVERTPVDTGRARGNWMPSIGNEPAVGEGAGDGKAVVEAVKALMPQLKIGQTAWLSNHLPYIVVLEYGLFPDPPKHGTGKTVGGYSTQSPNGMVRVSVLEFPDIVEESVKSV